MKPYAKDRLRKPASAKGSGPRGATNRSTEARRFEVALASHCCGAARTDVQGAMFDRWYEIHREDVIGGTMGRDALYQESDRCGVLAHAPVKAEIFILALRHPLSAALQAGSKRSASARAQHRNPL